MPIGLFINLGCVPKSPKIKYPIKLPGNKYRMINTNKDKKYGETDLLKGGNQYYPPKP